MIKKHKKNYNPLFLFTLIFLNSFLFFTEFALSDCELTVAVLNIGQGDAIYIESPSRAQVLIDSGPPRKLLSELSKVMPLFDRDIDILIATHPDTDHIGGFSEFLDNYSAQILIEPDIATDSKVYAKLKEDLKEKNIPSVVARKGMKINLGEGIILEILFPDRDVYEWETNTGSIVTRLSFGETSFMLTGDATKETEKIILENVTHSLKSDFLKIGHHGSSSSSSWEFLDAVSPTTALISVGEKNRYGHPTEEVLEELTKRGIKILRTDTNGTILIKSDGKDENVSFI